MSVKSTLLAGVAATALSATPLVAVHAQSAFDGFYAGAGVGYHHFNADNLSDDFIACCNSVSSLQQSKQSADGVIGGIFGGYGNSNGEFYVGAEAEFTYSGASKGFTVINNSRGEGQAEGHANISAKDGYGASARFGYLVMPNMLAFLRVGAEWQRFSADFTNTNGFDQPNIHADAFAMGARLGIGGDYAVAALSNGQQIFVRMEYDHTFYRNIRVGKNGTETCCGFRQGNTTLNFNPSDDVVRLAAGIRF